ncbi:hypothetical protein GCM10023185_17370 [Hymenobacter saemangeumensis]|uniref:DUF748 domain-containing protein n=1 Tax=Hymenobacter saemangeumensis TaxID=1084522 RepID=A0ABP8IAQ8_9BACT
MPATARRRVPRWLWWLLGTLLLVAGLLALARHWLDPWLRRKLEQQVSQQTQGQYRLQVAGLETSLWERAVRLRGLRLRPAGAVADTLPRLRLDVGRLHLTGVGLLALLRRGTVPLDSVVLDSVRLQLLALPAQPTRKAGRPLHAQLPLGLTGLEVGYLGLLHAQLQYGPATQPQARVEQAQVVAHELLLSAAGAADTQRVAYAMNWQLHLQQAQAAGAGHRAAAHRLRLATKQGYLTIDSLAVQPQPAGVASASQSRINLTWSRLALTGVQTAALQHQRRFRADSLLLQAPQLSYRAAAQPAATTWQQALRPYLRSLELSHLRLRDGQLRVAGTTAAPVLRGIEVSGAGVRLDSSFRMSPRQVLFAESWQASLGPSEARAAAHHLRLQSLQLSTKAGTFSLSSLRIVPPKVRQGGAVRVDLTLPRLSLTGLQPLALQHQHQLRADALQLLTPHLTFQPPSQPPPPIWQLLAPVARRVDIARVSLRDGYLHLLRQEHAPVIRQLNVTGTGIRIDSAAAADTRRIAYARDWQADAGRLATSFDAPFYQASSQRVRLSTATQTLRFEGLALTPAFSAVTTNLRKGYQAPAISVRLPSLTATGFDFHQLAHRGQFRIAQVTAQAPTVRISSDGRGPINPHRSKITPEQFRQLPVLLDIRRLDIRNGSLHSRYRSPLTPETGSMSITRFQLTFRNLSNDPRRQSARTPLTAQASAYLAGRCRMDVQAAIALLDAQGRHRVWGTFGPAPFSILNTITVPTRLVEFKKGQVQRIRFQLQADKQQVTGSMRAEYTGLQLRLLSYKDDEVKQSLAKRLLSKAANVVVIRDQNPRKGGKLALGEMTSRRESRFSVFTLWRQGVVSGLFHSVGLPQMQAQKISEFKDEAPLPK